MRRKDREVLDPTKINEIIKACHCCRLGFCDEGKVYIVPLNFGYEERENQKILYFHSAAEGRKIDLIQKNHSVGFEMDTNYELHTGEKACEYSAGFQSIIGTGRVDLVENREEKIRALELIMYHNTKKLNWEFLDKMVQRVAVIKLVVEEISCKEHL